MRYSAGHPFQRIALLLVACGLASLSGFCAPRPTETPAPSAPPATELSTATLEMAEHPTPVPTVEPTATPEVTPSPTTTPMTAATVAPEMTSVPTPASTTTLEIINGSDTDIWRLYLAPHASGQWGEDHLGDTVIAAGERFTLTGIPNGTYDILVERDLYNDIETQSGVAFDGLVTWTVTGRDSETVSVTIMNGSPLDIGYVYLTPNHSDQWGDNMLEGNDIAPGKRFALIGIGQGIYDVRAEDPNHNVLGTWFDAQFYEAYGPKAWMVVGGGDTASLTIVNSSSADIGYVTLASSYSDQWGDNLLADHVIAPGESFALTDIPFGTYDMRAETPDHGGIDARFEQTLDGPRTWEVARRSGEFLPRINQWAFAATASSERARPDWSAQQATGEPDTPGCGDHPTAWASAAADGVDWLDVRFRWPVIPRRINIHEMHAPGFVVRVEVLDAADQYHTVWEGEPTPADACPRLFSFLVTEVDVPVVGVRIHVDQRDGGNWNQIDAVELVGLEARL